MIEIFHIIAKKWFNNREGNTYHTVEIWRNNDFIIKSGIIYGYGDTYKQTAHEILQKKKFYPDTGIKYRSGISKDFCDFLNDVTNKKVIFHEIQVTRKKDL